MFTIVHRNNESIHFQLDIHIFQYFIESHDRKFYCTENHLTGSFIVIRVTCCLSKNCVERDYSLISLVLAIVKLVNMSCDKILNEVSFVYDKM